MADEFSDDFLDDDDIKKPPSAEAAAPKGGKNKVWVILVVAVLQTVLAIVIVDQLVLPARSELLEANEELLIKIQQERIAIDKKIKRLESMKMGEEVLEEAKSEEELTGLDSSKEGPIHEIKDLTIIPSGTQGEQIVLVSIGLQYSDEEAMTIMKAKEVILRDRIISILSSKTVDQVDETVEHIKLRQEIKSALSKYLPEGKELFNVYIFNFLIQ